MINRSFREGKTRPTASLDASVYCSMASLSPSRAQSRALPPKNDVKYAVLSIHSRLKKIVGRVLEEVQTSKPGRSAQRGDLLLTELLETCSRLETDLKYALTVPSAGTDAQGGGFEAVSKALETAKGDILNAVKPYSSADSSKAKAAVWEVFSWLHGKLFQHYRPHKDDTRELRRENERLLEFVSRLHDDKQALSKKAEELEKEARVYWEKWRSAEELVLEMDSVNEELKKANEAVEERIKELRTDYSALKADLTAPSSLAAENQDLLSQLSHSEAQATQLRAEVSALQSQLAAAQNAAARKEVALSKRLEAASVELQTVSGRLADKEKDCEDIHDRLRHIEQVQQLAVSRLAAEQEAANEEWEATVRALRADVERFKGRKEGVRVRCEVLEGVHIPPRTETIAFISERSEELEEPLAAPQPNFNAIIENLEKTVSELLGKNKQQEEALRHHAIVLKTKEEAINDKNAELEELRVRVAAVGRETAKVRTEADTIRAENERLTTVLQRIDQERSETQSMKSAETAQLQRENSALQAEIAVIREREKKVQSDLDDEQRSVASYKSTLAILENRLTQMRSQSEEQESTYSRLLEDYNTVRESMNGALGREAKTKEELSETVNNLRRTVEEMKHKEATLLAEQQELRGVAEGLSESLRERDMAVKAQTERLAAESSRLTGEKEELRDTVESLSADISEKKRRIAELSGQLSQKSAAVIEANESNKRLEETVSTLQTRVGELAATLKSESSTKGLLGDSVERVKALELEVAALKAGREKLNGEMKAKVAESTEVIEFLKEENGRLNEQLGALQQSFSDYRDRSNVVTAQRLEAVEAQYQVPSIQAALKARESETNRVATLESELYTAKQSTTVLTIAKEAADLQVTELQGRLKQSLEGKDKLESEVKRQFLAISALKDQVHTLNVQLESAKTVAETAVAKERAGKEENKALESRLSAVVHSWEESETAANQYSMAAEAERMRYIAAMHRQESAFHSLQKDSSAAIAALEANLQREMDLRAVEMSRRNEGKEQASGDRRRIQALENQLRAKETEISELSRSRNSAMDAYHDLEMTFAMEQQKTSQLAEEVASRDERAAALSTSYDTLKEESEVKIAELRAICSDLSHQVEVLSSQNSAPQSSLHSTQKNQSAPFHSVVRLEKERFTFEDIVDLDPEQQVADAMESSRHTTSNLQVCKRVRHQDTVWCLVSDYTDPSDFMWMRDTDVQQSPDIPPIDDDLYQQVESQVQSLQQECALLRQLHLQETTAAIALISTVLPKEASGDLMTAVRMLTEVVARPTVSISREAGPIPAASLQIADLEICDSKSPDLSLYSSASPLPVESPANESESRSDLGSVILNSEEMHKLYAAVRQYQRDIRDLESTVELQAQQLKLLKDERRAKRDDSQSSTTNTSLEHISDVFIAFCKGLPALYPLHRTSEQEGKLQVLFDLFELSTEAKADIIAARQAKLKPPKDKKANILMKMFTKAKK